MKKFSAYLLPVLVFAAFIFYLSSIPGTDIPSLFPLQDIFSHALEYFILAFLVHRAIRAYQPGLARRKRLYLAMLICIIYALTDEFHQRFVPYRNMSLLDVSVDSLAAVLGAVFYGIGKYKALSQPLKLTESSGRRSVSCL